MTMPTVYIIISSAAGAAVGGLFGGRLSGFSNSRLARHVLMCAILGACAGLIFGLSP